MEVDAVPTVEVAAGTIEYTEQGAGPPVVLLHGLLMNQTVWDQVISQLPDGFRYLRPTLPLGAHRIPMHPDADLSMRGQVQVVADLLAALDLREVTLVHSDWGGGLFLTAYGLDSRVSRIIVCPCEAFDNFPPGLPGKATKIARIPGGLWIALHQLRVRWLRRLPLLLGQMAKYPLADDVVRSWTEPGLRDRRVRRDLRRYAVSLPAKAQLIADTEALQSFSGEALILWSPENRVMPPEHGRRLAELIPHARLREIGDAYVLSMLDQPAAVAQEITEFLVPSLRH
jgi:pimeloyl-ACP methyl ester carboxylesterase